MQTFIFILVVHWLADFVLQTDEQAKNKSKSLVALFSHTIGYSILWIPALLVWAGAIGYELISMLPIFIFTFITFVAHTTTDYFTSRLNAKLWQQNRVHAFFVSVGFDQVLHYVQLLFTYHYLIAYI